MPSAITGLDAKAPNVALAVRGIVHATPSSETLSALIDESATRVFDRSPFGSDQSSLAVPPQPAAVTAMLPTQTATASRRLVPNPKRRESPMRPSVPAAGGSVIVSCVDELVEIIEDVG